MSVCASVIYPNTDPNAKFDMDYYLKTHMPLVAKNWAKYGFKEWKINHFTKGLGGDPPAYRVQALLYWDSVESVEKAVGSEEAKTVFGDVPNFTTISPVFTVGDVAGTAMV